MLGQIIEISGEGRRLSMERGFLKVAGPDGPLGQAPLDDIEALIISHLAASLSTQAIAALMSRGTPIVVSGADFRPCAMLLPLDGHYAQGDRLQAQIEASLPTLKRLWAEIVRAKITAQAAALTRAGVDAGPVAALVARVHSGDPDNLEAQAAQRYFPLLYGKEFRRNRNAEGTNAFLNYGYTVLRAAAARALVAGGLHPSLALKHKSRGEALRLADDVMEPFRPAVDLIAFDLTCENETELTPANKRRLAAVLHADYDTIEGRATLSTVLTRMAQSLAAVYLGTRKTLALPLSPLPVGAIAIVEEEE